MAFAVARQVSSLAFSVALQSIRHCFGVAGGVLGGAVSCAITDSGSSERLKRKVVKIVAIFDFMLLLGVAVFSAGGQRNRAQSAVNYSSM